MVSKMEKRCEVCGMEADPELRCEFEGETHYFHTSLCLITFEIQLAKIIAERNRLLEESRRSLGLSRFHPVSQMNETVLAHRQHTLECACKIANQDESTGMIQYAKGGQNDNF